MNVFLDNPLAIGILFLALFGLFLFQVIILLRIKSILQQISFYIESISRFFYRIGVTSALRQKKETYPKTCQFCKNRLSFIHMSENEGEVEDFYYKCRLRNTEITLDDTCEQFENERVN